MRLDDMVKCGEMGRRMAQRKRVNQVYMIEGESLTLQQIAERMGKTLTQAAQKMKDIRRKKKPDAITWELLGVK